ncbi:hypothetical protein C8Q80DRAFT_1213072, partial [Daedaleopsis nitida]
PSTPPVKIRAMHCWRGHPDHRRSGEFRTPAETVWTSSTPPVSHSTRLRVHTY